MNRSRKPLGRGLSNLLSNAGEQGTVVHDNPNYKELSLSSITPNPHQPRKKFEIKELEELAKTLHSIGLIEPIVVRYLGEERYEIIAGERRFRAAKIAGFKKIPAVLRQANDMQALEVGIIENIQREELNPVEEARAYQQWMSVTGQKADVLAKKVGKNRSTVKNLTRILKLPPEVLNMLENKQITIGQARPLLSIGDTKSLVKLATKVSNESWSSRKVEEEVARLTEGLRNSLAHKNPNMINIERDLRLHFSARVDVQYKKNGGGKIMIHYGNLKDLERLLGILKQN